MPGRASGRYACHTRSVRHASGTHICSIAASAAGKRQSWTLVACSEKSAKLTPDPSHVAPSGDGEPGQTRMAKSYRLVTRSTAEESPEVRWRGDPKYRGEKQRRTAGQQLT